MVEINRVGGPGSNKDFCYEAEQNGQGLQKGTK